MITKLTGDSANNAVDVAFGNFLSEVKILKQPSPEVVRKIGENEDEKRIEADHPENVLKKYKGAVQP